MLSNLHRSESSVIASTDGEKSVDSVKTPSEDDALPSDDESKYIVGRKLYLINVSLIVCLFIVQIESSIISTAVVDITDQLGGYEKSSWLFTAYLLSYCGLQVIWAKLADIVGRKYILLMSLCIFTLFSGLCGASQTIDQLIMFRWCQGCGGGGVFALVQLIFMELVPRRKLPAYLTMVMAAVALSLVVGPILGGGITLHGSWRWIFLINVPIGVLTIISLWFTFPKALWNEPAAALTSSPFISASLRRVDFVGAFLMVGTIVLLATGLQQAAQGYAWSSPMVLGLLITMAPFCIAFFTWQWYATTRLANPEPVFPWRMCQSRIRIGMFLNTFFSGTIQFVCIAQIPQRFITVNDLSPLAASVRLLTFGAFIPFGSAIAGILMGKGRIPPCYFVLTGAVLEIIGVVLLSRISTSHHIESAQYGFQVVAGLGNGMINAALILLIPYMMEKRDLAVGSAASIQFRILGGLVGLSIVVSISTPYVRSHLANIVSPELAVLLLERTEMVKELTPDTARQVRMLFGEAYNLQVKVLIGFAVAKLPATALMWTNQRSDT